MVVQLSDRQDCKHIDKFPVDRFVFLDGPVDRNIDNLVIADADHDVALSFLKCFYTCISQTTCQNSVEGAWGTASLKVSEDSHADIVLRILFADTVCIVHGAAVFRALGHDYDTAVLALSEAAADELLELIDICLVFRDDGSLRSGSNSAVLCKETRIASHDFHEENAVVGCRGITQLVHALDDCVEGCVVADGGIGAVKVIVNGTRQSDNREVILSGQCLSSGKGTVASDYYQSVNSEFSRLS